MKIFGQLEAAQFENLAADPSVVSRGRAYFNTALLQLRIYTGAAWTSYGVPSSQVTGSRGTPIVITAAGGITPAGVQDETQFIKGNSGSVVVSANPQIAAGTAVGQTLELIGRDATNTVELQDGNGLDLNGAWVGATNSTLGLRWDGTNWNERYRR